MKSVFRKLFGIEEVRAAEFETDTATVRKIVRQVDSMEPAEGRYIAAFAFVLSRVARSDMVISDEETRRMDEIVREVGGLEEAQAVLVVQIAKSQQTLMGGTENYLVTREFNRIASREQKEQVLRCLFEVSGADDSISLVEENEVRRIAEELGFDHREFTGIRAEFNEKRSILRKSSNVS